MSKVIAIGRRADILPFKVAGTELVQVASPAGAVAAFESIMEIPEPCVVMVTEDFMAAAASAIEKFRARRLRAVVAIPTLAAPPGKRREEISRLVARALGVDLLGRAEA